MICELSHDIFLSCRYLDKIMQINFLDKNKFLIYHENIVTSIEFMSHEEREIAKNIVKHTNKVIFGDEMGYLNIIKIEYKITNKKQMELEKIRILKNIKAHNCMIQGILFDKRLNIRIFCIKDIKISSYDLIHIFYELIKIMIKIIILNAFL